MSSTTDNEQRFAYLLSPEFQIVNTAGKPLTGGWIEVYIHGTRVKYYCFSDFDGTLHPFQIPLDSLGSNIVLASPTHAYDIYIYNKFGALVMSRYNVVPACNAADIVEDVVVIDSPDETINVECDGGSNWHLTVNTDLIATASGLAEVSGNLQDQIDGKKDIQQPYAASGTVTQTITKIEQNENGEIEVTYANIELPPEVPNINIISPSGTIDVTSNTDPTTNTKTFKIDVHNNYMQHFIGNYGRSKSEFREPDALSMFYLDVDSWNKYEYEGDFITNNWQQEGTHYINVNPGLYFVHAIVKYNMSSSGNSDEYMAIARGSGNIDNSTTNTYQYKDWSHEADLRDNTIELSYVRKVGDGAAYGGIEVAPMLPYGVSYAFIYELEIVKLDSIAFDNGGTGPRYSPGYGINIPDYTIEIDPTVVVTHNYFTTAINLIQEEINEINTTIQNVTGDITELSETVTNIVGVTGDFATNEDLQIVSGAIPESQEVEFQELDVDSLATTEYVDNRIASAAGDVYEAGQYISIDNNVINVTGVQPEGDYATNADLQTVSAAIPESEDVEFEEVDLAQFAQASAVTVIQNEINNVTGDINNINEAITNIIGATGDYATEEYVNEAIAAVSGEQQQSDWTQDDDTKVDYIKHKPREVNLVAGDNIAIEQDGLDVIISATGVGDAYEAGQYISIQNGTIAATGLQPEGDYATEQYVDEAIAAVTGQPFEQVNSDWNATSGVAEILNRPDVFQLIAGDNIDITPSGNDLVISAESDVTKAYVDEQIAVATGMIPEDTVTHAELNNTIDAATGLIPTDTVSHVELNDAIDTVTGLIPEAQVNSDWLATSGKAEILNKPQEEAVEFEEVNLSDYALASAIPDVSHFVTQQDIDDTVAHVQSQVDTLAAATGDYLQSSDLDGYATEQYVDDAVNAATGLIPQDTVTHVELADAIDSATALIPDVSEFVTQQDIDDSIAPVQSQIDTLAAATGDYLTEQVNADWNATSGVAEILNKPESEAVEFEEVNLSDYALASAIPSLEGYATETYVDTQIAAVTGIIPSDAVTEQELSDAINAATGMIPPVQAQIDDLVAATGDYLTEQVNADWNATSGVAEILNKPQAEEVTFEELNLNDYALASAIPSLEGYATEAYVDAAISAVSGGTFEQVNSDWDATSGVAEILNKPEVLDIAVGNVIAGNNISITASGDDIVISAQGGGGSSYTAGQYISIENNTISVTGVQPAGNYATEQYVEGRIDAATGLIPDVSEFVTQQDVNDSIAPIQAEIDDLVAATGDYLQSSDLDGYATEAYVDAAVTGASFTQVNADWNATSGVAEILNKPTEKNLVAGANVTITESNDEVTIESTEIASGLQLVAGPGVTMTVSGTNLVVSANSGMDETLLWSGTYSGSVSDSNYITLSEDPANFEYVMVSNGAAYGSTYTYRGNATTWSFFQPFAKNDSGVTVVYATRYDVNHTNLRVTAKGISSYNVGSSGISGYSNASSMNVGEVQLTKVIGVNRISS